MTDWRCLAVEEQDDSLTEHWADGAGRRAEWRVSKRELRQWTTASLLAMARQMWADRIGLDGTLHNPPTHRAFRVREV